ncbi:MAG: GspE/PulE family protein [Desulfovibrionaceae bacterium]|nr:GspE/PulE family protein [Desulfovibrionaceae bacterium]
MASPDEIARINERLTRALALRGFSPEDLTAPPGTLVTDQLVARRLADPQAVNEVLREVFGVEAIDPSMVALDPEFVRNVRLLFPRSEAFALRAVPLRFDHGTAHVVMAVPEDERALADIEHLLGSRVVAYVCHSEGLARAMAALYGEPGAPGDAPSPDLALQAERAAKAVARIAADHVRVRDPAEDPEVTALMRAVMDQLASARAGGATSDIHVEPGAHAWRIRARRDGMLYDALAMPPLLGGAVARRLMLLSGMDPGETRFPQDGAIGFTLAKDRPMDIRVSALPALYGPKIVMRLLEKGKKALRLADLDFSPAEDRIIRAALAAPNGLLLVTGPTGSGKTTTLYAFLGSINTPEVNILTAEDPVEYRLDGATQVPCPGEGGMTFAQAMRSFLRQDPDIIMAGEIRDAETADFAVKAALTGHLVLSTLHTNDAPGAVSRLANMGVAPHLLAATRVTVLAQRLVRRLCPDCRRRAAPPPGFPGLDALPPETVFYEPAGCDRCQGSGYRGRIGVYEAFTVTGDMERLILGGAATAELRRAATAAGMESLRASALRRLAQGLTSAAEVLRVTAEV